MAATSVSLTHKQEAFALAYVKTGNASEAYRQAYDASNMADNSIWNNASVLLKHTGVAARIEELREPVLIRHNLTAERVLREVARIAFFDPRKLYEEDGVTLKNPKDWDDDTAAAVASLEIGEMFEGKGDEKKVAGLLKKLKMHDKNSALEKAMKHLGLFEKDNVQRGDIFNVQIAVVNK